MSNIQSNYEDNTEVEKALRGLLYSHIKAGEKIIKIEKNTEEHKEDLKNLDIRDDIKSLHNIVSQISEDVKDTKLDIRDIKSEIRDAKGDIRTINKTFNSFKKIKWELWIYRAAALGILGILYWIYKNQGVAEETIKVLGNLNEVISQFNKK